MENDLINGYDVVAHFSQSAVERVFQSYYQAGVLPSHVSAPFSQGSATHTVEVFYGLPRLRFVSVTGVQNAIRLTFGYIVRLTNHDQEWPGEASVVVSAIPLTMPAGHGTFVTALGIVLNNTGLGQLTFTPASYPEFEEIVKPLIATSILGSGRSIFFTPPATPSPQRLGFRIYPGPGDSGFLSAFVTVEATPAPPPATMTSLLSPSQDLAVAAPVELVDQILADGLAAAGLGDLPTTMEFDGEERTVQALRIRLRDHYLDISGEIDDVEFTAKALLYARPDGITYQVLIQDLDVDLPWYADVVDVISGGAITRAIGDSFPAMIGALGDGASGGLGVFASRIPTVETSVDIHNKGYAAISEQGMVVGASVTAKPVAAPIVQPTYLVGNRKSREFHRAGCPYGDKVKQRELFIREAAAIRSGYNGCFTCAHEYSHPFGKLTFGFRSPGGNLANALLTVPVSIVGKLVTQVVVDGVTVTDPPFTRDATLKVKVKPDGSWQTYLYDSTSQLIPGTWRLRATSGAWTGEVTATIVPTARNFGASNMIAFTLGIPAGAIGYGQMPPFP